MSYALILAHSSRNRNRINTCFFRTYQPLQLPQQKQEA
nr:MAG TPA: hypothetical protein [Caudoviricetes sp.]